MNNGNNCNENKRNDSEKDNFISNGNKDNDIKYNNNNDKDYNNCNCRQKKQQIANILIFSQLERQTLSSRK